MSRFHAVAVPASPVMTREVVDPRRARCGSRSEDVGGPVRPRAWMRTWRERWRWFGLAQE